MSLTLHIYPPSTTVTANRARGEVEPRAIASRISTPMVSIDRINIFLAGVDGGS